MCPGERGQHVPFGKRGSLEVAKVIGGAEQSRISSEYQKWGDMLRKDLESISGAELKEAADQIDAELKGVKDDAYYDQLDTAKSALGIMQNMKSLENWDFVMQRITRRGLLVELNNAADEFRGPENIKDALRALAKVSQAWAELNMPEEFKGQVDRAAKEGKMPGVMSEAELEEAKRRADKMT